MTDRRFGRLLGVSYAHTDDSGHAHWLFACDCGNSVVADGANVRSGNTGSCGCLHRENASARLIVHGEHASRRHEPTYRAWQAMKSACYDPNSSGYRWCGARGILVDPRWRSSFVEFLSDMGERPAEAVLRRIDQAADFTSSNCAWMPRPSRAQRAADAHRRARSSRP